MPEVLADPEWRQYSQAAIAAEKRYIKKTTISAITKERDEKIKKLEAVMEEKIKALGGSALDRPSAGGVLATEMALQAAAITKTFAAKLAAREIIDKQMAERKQQRRRDRRRRRRSAGRKAGPSSRQVRSSG